MEIEKQKKKVGCLKFMLIGFGVMIFIGILGGILSNNNESPEASTNKEQAVTKAKTQEKIKPPEPELTPLERAEKNLQELVEPDWGAMYGHIQKEVRDRDDFFPPEIGSKVEIELKAGGIYKTGDLHEIQPDMITLKAGKATRGFSASDLSMNTRLMFFEDDYINATAREELLVEKKKFQSKKDKLLAAVQEEKDMIAAKQQIAATAARKKEFEAAFSSWNGSHKELVKLVKSNMNDPKSFEHVETTFVGSPPGYLVQMIYSGKNAFGGRVKAQVIVKVSSTGQILEIVSE